MVKTFLCWGIDYASISRWTSAIIIVMSTVVVWWCRALLVYTYFTAEMLGVIFSVLELERTNTGGWHTNSV
jgi:hypothetical protein